MATTTNYGWTTPDDTALVKDGASAIRTLGSSVDTTTKNLNPETTLGDISFRSSSANVKTRLGIGSTGNVLTVAAGVPSWAAPAGGGMTLLSTTTLTGASTTISGISQDYINLQLVITGVTASANFVTLIKINNQTTLSSYGTVESNAGTVTTNNSNNGMIEIGGASAGLSSDADNVACYLFYNYTSSTNYKVFTGTYGITKSGGGNLSGMSGGAFRSNTAMTSFVLAPSSGTFSTGTALLYGVK